MVRHLRAPLCVTYRFGPARTTTSFNDTTATWLPNDPSARSLVSSRIPRLAVHVSPPSSGDLAQPLIVLVPRPFVQLLQGLSSQTRCAVRSVAFETRVEDLDGACLRRLGRGNH